MALDTFSATKAANALAARAGLSVVFHDEDTDKFCTDTEGRLFIPTPQPDWSDDEASWWRNGYGHEIGHHMPAVRDIFPIINAHKIDMRSLFGAALNIVDDVRNDHNRCREFSGMVADSVKAWQRIATKNIIPQLDEWNPDERTQSDLALTTMFAGTFAVRSFEHAALESYASMVADRLPEGDAQHWYGIMLADGWLDRWYRLTTAHDEYVFVRELLRDVFEVEEEKLPPEDPGQPADDGEQGEGEGEEGEKTTSKDKGAGDLSDDPSGDSDSDGDSVTLDYEKLLDSPSHDNETRARGREIKIEYSGYLSHRDYSPHTPQTTVIGNIDECLKHAPMTYGDYYTAAGISKLAAQVNVSSVINQARTALQVKSRKLWNTNLKRGRLDTRKLHKLATHDMRHGNPEVFKQPGQRVTLDTAVSVLVDCSGSMHHSDKYPLAAVAAFGMLEMCRIIHVPIEIAGFSEYSYDKNAHPLFKSWTESVSEQELFARFAKFGTALFDNADGDNIMIAYHRLLQRPEKKKLLMVISDGQPAADRGDIYSFTKKVIREIENDKHVDIMGIGILDHAARGMYTNSAIIDTANAIPSRLVEILKANVVN